MAREKAAAVDDGCKDLELIEMQEDESGARGDDDVDDDDEQEEAEWSGGSNNGYHKVATSDLHEEEAENGDQDLDRGVMKEDGKDSYNENGGPFFKDQNEWSWNLVRNNHNNNNTDKETI